MQGKTHRLGGTVCAMVGFIALKETGSLMSSDVVSPVLQFLTIYTAGIYGGLSPDNDHHFESSPLHDPASYVHNKLLHLFNKPYKMLDNQLSAKDKRKSLWYKLCRFLSCRHRSWQTHSEVSVLVIGYLLTHPVLPIFHGYVDPVLWSLIVLGFGFGVLSHILLDMLTTEGVPIALAEFCQVFFGWTWLPSTFRLVPKSSVFKTGSQWELSVRKGLELVQYVLIAVIICYAFGISVPSIVQAFLK